MSIKLLIVSVDGLSKENLFWLCKAGTALNSVVEHGSVKDWSVPESYHVQTAWAELLTGRPLEASGCAGYSVPRGSLNNCKVVSETDLHGVTLTNRSDESLNDGIDVLINVPMTSPDLPYRYWLSDGTVGGGRQFFPPQLKNNTIVNAYKARPFSSIVEAKVRATESIREAIAVECLRLQAASALCQEPVRLFVLRIGLFDILSQLMGIDFMQMHGHNCWDDLLHFLSVFDETMHNLVAEAEAVAVVSANCWEGCHATVNINAGLQRAGLASLVSIAELKVSSEMQARKSASAALMTIDETMPNFDYPLMIKCRADQTRALSVMAGAVHINVIERYKDGIVTNENFLDVQDEAQNVILSVLRQVGEPRTRLASVQADSLPDITFYVPGVDMSCYHRFSVERTNKPHAVFCPRGFAILPENSYATERITGSELNGIFMELLS